MLTRLRQSVVVHRYVGIAIGLLICIIGLTGSYLVVQDRLVYGQTSDRFEVVPQAEHLSINAMIDAAEKASSDFKVSQLNPGSTPDEAYALYLNREADGKSKSAYIDPYTGKILYDSEKSGDTLVNFIFDLHSALAMGDWGWNLVGVVGLLLVVLGISGLIIWPHWKNFPKGLKIRWNSPVHLVTYDIHKVVGILGAAFLLLITITGAGISFWSPYESLIYSLTDSQPTIDRDNPQKSTVIEGKARLSFNELVQNADAAFPDGVLNWVSIPTEPDQAFEIGKLLPNESNRWRWSIVLLDQYSGKVLAVDDAYKRPLGGFLLDSTISLHNGTYGGALTRIIYLFIGLAPTILFVTGLGIWWNKRRRGTRVQRAVSVPASTGSRHKL